MSISKEKFDDEDLESTKSYSFDGSSSSRQGSFLLDDVESQRIALPLPAEGAEYSVATRTKLLYLAGYFALNLCLTLYNKAALQKVCGRLFFVGAARRNGHLTRLLFLTVQFPMAGHRVAHKLRRHRIFCHAPWKRPCHDHLERRG